MNLLPPNPTRRLFALLAIGSLGLVAACGGGDDDDVSAASTPTAADDGGDAAGSDGSAADFGGPDATISEEVDESYLVGIGPVEVRGDSLPGYVEPPIEDDAALGEQAPVVIGLDFDDQPVRIDPVEDGPTMVVFLAHWCPHCNDEVPMINEMRDAGQFPDELNIVAVSTGIDPAAPNWPPGEWLEHLDWTYPVIADGVDFDRQVLIAQDAFGIRGYPFIVLLDDDGTVAARWSGASEADELSGLIEEHLGLTAAN